MIKPVQSWPYSSKGSNSFDMGKVQQRQYLKAAAAAASSVAAALAAAGVQVRVSGDDGAMMCDRRQAMTGDMRRR